MAKTNPINIYTKWLKDTQSAEKAVFYDGINPEILYNASDIKQVINTLHTTLYSKR